MNQTEFFAMLGAPLRNSRWSWGAVRPSDGAVFLRVWWDRTRTDEGRRYVQITHHSKYVDNPRNPGYRERGEHLDLIRGGAPAYLVFCEAEDRSAMPRKIRRFEVSEIFPGGRLKEFDGETWIETLPGIPVKEIARARD